MNTNKILAYDSRPFPTTLPFLKRSISNKAIKIGAKCEEISHLMHHSMHGRMIVTSLVSSCLSTLNIHRTISKYGLFPVIKHDNVLWRNPTQHNSESLRYFQDLFELSFFIEGLRAESVNGAEECAQVLRSEILVLLDNHHSINMSKLVNYGYWLYTFNGDH